MVLTVSKFLSIAFAPATAIPAPRFHHNAFNLEIVVLAGVDDRVVAGAVLRISDWPLENFKVIKVNSPCR